MYWQRLAKTTARLCFHYFLFFGVSLNIKLTTKKFKQSLLDSLHFWDRIGAVAKLLVCLHRKKRFTSFPYPAGMSLTKLPLGRNNSVMTSLFPPRESFGSDIPAGDGKLTVLFFTVYLPHPSLKFKSQQGTQVALTMVLIKRV
jgi:hypothetical protein